MTKIRKSRLNNMQASRLRDNELYEMIINDLVLMGVVDKEDAVRYMRREVSEILKEPEYDI